MSSPAEYNDNLASLAALPALLEKWGSVSYTHLDVYKRQEHRVAIVDEVEQKPQPDDGKHKFRQKLFGVIYCESCFVVSDCKLDDEKNAHEPYRIGHELVGYVACGLLHLSGHFRKDVICCKYEGREQQAGKCQE